jgi:LysM repeat protein
MEAVMSALSAIEMPVVAADACGADSADVSSRERLLRVVGRSTPAVAVPAVHDPIAAAQPRSSSIPILTGTVVAGRSPRSGSGAARGTPAPLRLTRRGRIVVSALLVAVLSVAVLLVTTLLSGRAQATNHGGPRAGYQGMHQVVVRPGQTLWSIASAADPTADPRNVVQEIMSANTLSSPSIAAGQLLWVP